LPSSGSLGGHHDNHVHYARWTDHDEATALLLRNNAAGQAHVSRLASKHGKGKSRSILAAKLRRAVYLMLSKGRVFETDRFLAGAR